jgi:tetratricopeptide (TPR) repeat protein
LEDQANVTSLGKYQRLVLGAGLILLATLLVYIPAMQSGFIWDDDRYVTENPTLRSLEGLTHTWLKPSSNPQYYPLVFTSFWLEYRLWGLNPAGYHVVNVLLHALNALLLWLLFKRLKVPGGWFAAMLFALHPVQVESVAWVTERKNVLSALFYFSSAFCLFRFFGINGEAEDQPHKWSWYALGFLLFLFALLSKTVACSLPAAMILVLWWKRDRIPWSEVVALLPFFIFGIALGLTTVWLERHHVGAEGVDWELSMVERFLLAGRALWFYASKLAWPADLTFNYQRWQVNAGVWWQYIYPLGVLALVSLLWAYRGRLGRGPLAGILFFCGTLFPALGFFDVYPFRFSFVADHFQYLASVGLFGLAVGVLANLASKKPTWTKRTVATLGSLFLVVLATLTWVQGLLYENAVTLWMDTLKKNPESFIAHNNLGNILHQQGRLHEAKSHFLEALRVKPDAAEVHNNLGISFDLEGRQEEAIVHFTEALRLNPQYVDARNNLGVALAGQGKLEEAIVHFSEVLRLKPKYAEAHNNLALALTGQGKLEEAIAHFTEALRIKPDYAEAHNNLGAALVKQGKFNEAISHYSEALRIIPDYVEAHNNLGAALANQGRFDEAIDHYAKAQKIEAEKAKAHNQLGLTLAKQGKIEEAIAHFTEAIRIKPDHVEAYNNLGVALTSQGRLDEAIDYFSEALKIEPDYAEAHNNLGLALAAQGDTGRAIIHFTEALRIMPDYAEAQKNLQLFLPLTGKASGESRNTHRP